jgi:1-acyl-sn-glycerol-3-phosphate acyltransferase
LKQPGASLGVRVHAVWKCVRVLVQVVSCLFSIAWVFPKLSARQKDERIKAVTQALLAQMTIKLVVQGEPPVQGPVMLAANHISWLDILVMRAAHDCRFVSKSEVRHWPLIGSLAVGAGTLFIERESRRDAMRVVHHMAEHLRAGEILAIFPEGTTSNGVDLLPFHANLFQSAISAHAPVQPVALKFVDAVTGELSLAPCYIDDDTLLGSIWRTLTAPPLCAVVTFGEPQFAQERERRAWAADVRTALGRLRA